MAFLKFFLAVIFIIYIRITLLRIVEYFLEIILLGGQGSSVGLVTVYGLDGLGIEVRWGARFSAPVQIGPGAHPASCTMGTGSFPGVQKRKRHAADPSPLLVPWS